MSYEAKGLDFCLACLEQLARLADQSVEDAFAAHGRALKMANCRSPHGDGRDGPCQVECQVSWLNRQRFGFLRKFGEKIAGLMPTCTYRHPRRGTNPLQFLGPLNSLCFVFLVFFWPKNLLNFTSKRHDSSVDVAQCYRMRCCQPRGCNRCWHLNLNNRNFLTYWDQTTFGNHLKPEMSITIRSDVPGIHVVYQVRNLILCKCHPRHMWYSSGTWETSSKG